jgi:hypothetical protein
MANCKENSASLLLSLAICIMAAGKAKVRGATLNAYDFSNKKSFPQAKYIQKGKKYQLLKKLSLANIWQSN